MNNGLAVSKSRQITYFAVLAALTTVLQLIGNTARIGILTLNFSLVPIVLAGLLLGTWYGAALGALTGLIILLNNGILGADGFTNVLFATDPIVIILVCILKTAVAGAVCALIYKALKNRNEHLGVFLSSAAVPVVNSGLFAIGMFLIVPSLINAGFMTESDNAFAVVILGFIGLNFVFELGVNIIVSPAIYRVVRIIDKNFSILGKSAEDKNVETETEEKDDNKGNIL